LAADELVDGVIEVAPGGSTCAVGRRLSTRISADSDLGGLPSLATSLVARQLGFGKFDSAMAITRPLPPKVSEDETSVRGSDAVTAH
jgi:hypothetical protein